MPFIQVNSQSMSYWTPRKGLIEGKDTVLFIHGAGGGQYSWSLQKGLLEKEFNLVIIELPGHGESEGEGEEEIGKYTEHVYAFMRALDLKEVFIVGHSMGGAIAQTLALAHKETMKGIVLVGTGAKLKVFPMILEGIKNNFEETVRKINQFAFSPKAPADLIEKGVSLMLQHRPEVLYGDFLACDRFNVMDEVEKIVLPTLIICGEDDQLTTLKYSQFLHGRIKGSQLQVIPNAGHMVMMESPDAFNERVREFISHLNRS